MNNQKIDLALAFLQSQPESAAAVLEQQPAEYVSEFLKNVPYTHAAAVLNKMLPQYTSKICKNLDPAVSASFLSEMEVSLVAAILRHSDEGLRNQILKLLPERTKIASKLLLNYAEHVVGAWMVANTTLLPVDCTVEEALSRLASEDGVINSDVVHVVDREKKLQGLVTIGNLLRSSSSTLITKIMEKKCAVISGRTALVSAANHAVWTHQDTIAVINRHNQIVGVLCHADLRKGLYDMSSTNTMTNPIGSGPLTGIYEVYGSSLLALFSTISEVTSSNRP